MTPLQNYNALAAAITAGDLPAIRAAGDALLTQLQAGSVLAAASLANVEPRGLASMVQNINRLLS